MERFYDDTDSLFVRAYDAFYRVGPPPIAGGVAFYERLARGAGGPVLELACGTGRIALTLAENGLDVTGVDVSDGMLAIAHRKLAAQRVSLIRQDMTELALPRQFGCIIIAFRSFQHLLTVELQRRALAAIHRHLAPHGRLVLHLFDPRLDLLMDETVRRDLWRYREYTPEGALLAEDTREMALRWIYRWELRHLLELCSFTIDAEYSDFAGSPPAYGKEQIVIAAAS